MTDDACTGCDCPASRCNPELCCPDCSHKPDFEPFAPIAAELLALNADKRPPPVLVLSHPPKPKNKRVIYKEDPSCDYFTPRDLRVVVFDVLGGFPSFDPATSTSNPMQALAFFTKEHNALVRPWPDVPTLFCNPPYGRKIRHWIRLLARAAERGATVLALLPCRPGSIWYRQATRSAQLLCEVNGRVAYELPSGEPAPAGARWASCFLYWGPDRQRVARKLRDVGEVRMCRRLERSHARGDVRDVVPVDPRQLRLVKS